MKKSKIHKPKLKMQIGRRWLLVVLILGLPIGLLLALASFYVYYYGKILPRTYVLGMRVDGLKPSEAQLTLAHKYPLAEQYIFVYSTGESEMRYEIPMDSLGVTYDYKGTAEGAYKIARGGNALTDLYKVLKSFWSPTRLSIKVSYNEEKLSEAMGVIVGQISVEPVYPSATLGNGEVLVNEGKAGIEVDLSILKSAFFDELARAGRNEIIIRSKVIDPTINEMEQMMFRDRAERLIDKSLVIMFEDDNLTYELRQLVEMVAVNGYRNEVIESVIGNAAAKFEREAQNPAFVFANGRVEEFTPAKAGVRIKSQELRIKIYEAMAELESAETDEVTVEAPVDLTPAEFETSEVNNLGIKELIGRGVSNFRGSIASRVYNINLAATRINGTLIKPGEVFSFNNTVGDVSKLTGYKEAYIIQDGKTILGDGGGLCQVSTTLFRAALDAGLPILERRAHTYRVGYYEQGFAPGLDATVYSPTTDFKFKNDTPTHILIQATPDTKNLTLVFELYGTSDGRVATTTKPVITESTPPPDDVYIDDPSLPTGQVKQVEYKAWGAKVVFNYNVVRNGETIYEKTFYSVYKPWGAVYMRGTAPVL